MKQKLFVYLFIFSALLNLYLFVNYKRTSEEQYKKIEKSAKHIVKYKDSVNVLNEKVSVLSHFNIETDEDAMSYFESDGYEIDELLPYIKDQLAETNSYKGNEHPLIPYASSEGRKHLINTVKILNHRWVIADFSDGELWGQVFIKYFINEDGSMDFETVESLLYPNF